MLLRKKNDASWGEWKRYFISIMVVRRRSLSWLFYLADWGPADDSSDAGTTPW
jgi:hypothetical protein